MSNLAIHRVAITLDATTQNSRALQAAVELSAQLNAQLSALFIEDANLLRLANLPFAREIRRTSGIARRLTMDSIQRRLSSIASAAKSSLAYLALQAQVNWTFEVVQRSEVGMRWDCPPAIDLLVVGASQSFDRQRAKLPHSVTVIVDTSTTAQQALTVARHLADQWNAALYVLVNSGESAAVTRMQNELPSGHATQRHSGRELLTVATPEEIVRTIRRQSNSCLLVPRGCNVVSLDVLNEIATCGDCVLGIVQ